MDAHPSLPGWSHSTFSAGGVWTPKAPDGGVWTPDGKYFVFSAGSGSGNTLWALCEKRSLFQRCPSGPVQLTTGPLSFDSPVFSRDGKKAFALGTLQRVELVRYDSKSRQFASYLGGISADEVSFSKDGQWVAYTLVPEEYAVAKQTGWQRAVAAYFPATARRRSSLVSGWNENRFPGRATWQAGQDLCCLSRRRPASAGDEWRSQ